MTARARQHLFRWAFLTAAVLLAALVSYPAAQQPAGSSLLASRPTGVLRANVEMVLLPVSVTDDRYRSISGLARERFQLSEDGKPQEIVSVVEVDDPISVGLIFDGSGSMADQIELCKQAVRAFVEHAHPDDEYFLIEFSDHPHLLSGFTPRVDRILSLIGGARGGGRTALYDAIYLGLAEMQHARHPRRILLVLSDGADNHSRYSPNDIRQSLRESGVQIYTIGVFDPSPYRTTPEEVRGPSNMAGLAEMSGGRGFVLGNPAYLPDVTAKISRELRTLYRISYYPTNKVHNGQWRKIEVEVNPPPGAPPLNVSARSGYYAPAF